MTPELKEQLLLRLFSSLEYMEEFTEHYVAGLQDCRIAGLQDCRRQKMLLQSLNRNATWMLH
jgi:hypothetical protein